MATDIQQTPFVKQLAANDRPTRDKALQSLRTYLSGRRELPALELMKLWKGLFYCMWMSDRPRTQQQLANDLAALVSVLPSATVIPFLRAFWQTMQREWTNIDVLRMEKFLLLTRRYLGATFSILKEGKWEEELVKEHMALLEEIPCNIEDMRIPNGMRFHVIDIYIDELERVSAIEDEEASLDLLLEPLKKLSKSSPTKPVRTKCKEALGDERLPGNEKSEPEKPEDDGWGGFDD
ncbi:hypothetical protein BP5796_00259 [Coleophoma crateriformis]|uniref:Uncharacterized protein n=2 Tax=Coleophoma TaxID=453209 RepID=A0A3D8SRK3_9HELO|nr:hypothetical protein BP6252_00959 [Coleophoma cylindrospora]RDW94496.1 hypothetical protein BP5796_00259 [Coleophoma crateriformis]